MQLRCAETAPTESAQHVAGIRTGTRSRLSRRSLTRLTIMGVNAMTESARIRIPHSPSSSMRWAVTVHSVVVEGAVIACERGLGPITLIGPKLASDSSNSTPIRHQISSRARQNDGMGKNPIRAARSKRESSVHLAIRRSWRARLPSQPVIRAPSWQPAY